MVELVSYSMQEGIALVTMDDGQRNVLSPGMLARLDDAVERAREEGATLLLRGRPGIFSAGFDLSVLTQGGLQAVDMLNAGFALGEKLLALPTPVVVACTGHALAMGAFLVLSADYSLGTEGAFKLGANEVAIGLTMPHAAIEICRQRLPPAYFHRVVNTAEILSPAQALDCGFIDELVDTNGFDDRARHAATRLAALDKAAFAATKQRSRAQTLQALQSARQRDDADFRAMLCN